jgi:ABC-type polysaccharide/polyol phosphate export permease
MDIAPISRAMRLFFAVSGTVIWLGIWLTGLSAAHWLLYLPATFFYFAAATGICPGLIVSRLIFPDRR